jgi:hypothetical protein
MKNKNNNTIRAKKFKVGSLYRNDTFPQALYLCIGDVNRGDKGDVIKRKSLIVLKDCPKSGDNNEGHIVTSEAVKNWHWREV